MGNGTKQPRRLRRPVIKRAQCDQPTNRARIARQSVIKKKKKQYRFHDSFVTIAPRQRRGRRERSRDPEESTVRENVRKKKSNVSVGRCTFARLLRVADERQKNITRGAHARDGHSHTYYTHAQVHTHTHVHALYTQYAHSSITTRVNVSGVSVYLVRGPRYSVYVIVIITVVKYYLATRL